MARHTPHTLSARLAGRDPSETLAKVPVVRVYILVHYFKVFLTTVTIIATPSLLYWTGGAYWPVAYTASIASTVN